METKTSENVKTSDFEKEKKEEFLEKNNDFINNIPVKITVELGTKKIKIKNLLELKEKSIITLDNHVEDSLKIYVNDYLIAKGNIVVTDNSYGIQISKIYYSKYDKKKRN